MKSRAPLRRVRVFVASPADVSTERRDLIEVVNELNTTIAPHMNCTLELVRWETHCQPNMGRPQGIINAQIGSYDIFIGIMWKRFGTPTGEADSGTEEEFRRAYKCWVQDQSVRILFYFSQASYKLESASEIDQLSRVMSFRSELQTIGLVWEYSSASGFRDVVRPHLARLILDLPNNRGKSLKPALRRPKSIKAVRVFIASSNEGLVIASKLQIQLRKAKIEAVLWKDAGVFSFGSSGFESFEKVLDDCGAAIMVLSPNDDISSRGNKHQAARERLIYEIGLFHGRHGRHRTFVLVTKNLNLPSDLDGLAYFWYDPKLAHRNVGMAKLCWLHKQNVNGWPECLTFFVVFPPDAREGRIHAHSHTAPRWHALPAQDSAR